MGESLEMYLETIYVLKSQREKIKAIDIVNYMNLSKPSVSAGLKKLEQNFLITRDLKQYISLTQKGEEVAKAMYEKCQTIIKFLEIIGVDNTTAKKDACKIEHILSQTSLECISAVVNNRCI